MSFLVLTIVALAAASCGSGGGTGAFVPGQATGTSAAHHALRGAIVLRIPRHRRHRRGRAPAYISPGTASLTVLVQPVAVSGPNPTPMPLQILNVTVPKPCKFITSSTLECEFSVMVMPGQDTFKFETFPQLGGKGALLSGYASGVETIPSSSSGKAPPLSFTLDGAVSTVNITYPSAPSSKQSNVEVVPVGTAAPPVAVSVKAIDAAGYEILEPSPGPKGTYTPYLNAITLSVSPADGNVTLTSTNSPTAATTLKITDPSGLQNVQMTYNGGFTVSSGVITTDQYTVNAAIGSVVLSRPHAVVRPVLQRAAAPTPTPTAPPQQGVLELSSNNLPVQVNGATATGLVPLGIIPGANAKTLFAVYETTYPLDAGAIVAVNAASGAITAGPLNITYEPADFSYDATNDALWVTDYFDQNSNDNLSLRCYSGALVENPSSPFLTGNAYYVAVNSGPQLWYGDTSSNLYWQQLTGQCGPIGAFATFGPPANYTISADTVPAGATAIAVGSSEYYNGLTYSSGSAYTVDSSTGFSAPIALPTPDPSATYYPVTFRQDPSSGNIYAGVKAFTCSSSGSCSNYIGKISGGTMTSLATVPYTDNVAHLAVSGTTVGFVDTTRGGIGLLDTTTNAVTILPLQCTSIGGMTFDFNGTPWVNCSSNGSLMLLHVLQTRNWQLFYNPNDFSCGSIGIIGIGGAQPSDNFTVSGTGAFTSVAIAPSGTEVEATPASCAVSSSATGTVTVTETNSGRSQTLSLTAHGPVGAPPRHGRRGYPNASRK